MLRTLILSSAIALFTACSNGALNHDQSFGAGGLGRSSVAGTVERSIATSGDDRFLPAAEARSYGGNWPLTVSHSHYAKGKYCLTLTDDGSLGWPHSGPASLTGARIGGKLPYGTFQVIDHTLVATIQQPGGSQNAGLVLIGPASGGNIGKGVYEQVYGGEAFDTGELAYGAKGAC